MPYDESNALSLAGKTCVVTGAASGLGLAISRKLGSHGATVELMDLNAEQGQLAARALREDSGIDAKFTAVDVSKHASVAEAFRDLTSVDVLVNCAGIREISPAEDLTPSEWDRVVNVNLNGVFYCVHETIPLMKNGEGSVVNIASVAGLIAMENRPAYSATKHAVIGLTKNLSHDLGHYGIRVNAVAPGTIRTPLTDEYFTDPAFVKGLSAIVPLPEEGSPEDVANATLFLSSSLSKFISGVVLPVDGGWLAEKNYAPSGGSAVYSRH